MARFRITKTSVLAAQKVHIVKLLRVAWGLSSLIKDQDQAAAITMTWGNQGELAHQKNMKKQSHSVKGKLRDDGLSAAGPQAEGLRDHAAEAEKGNREEGGTQIALCPTPLPVCLEPVPPWSFFL